MVLIASRGIVTPEIGEAEREAQRAATVAYSADIQAYADQRAAGTAEVPEAAELRYGALSKGEGPFESGAGDTDTRPAYAGEVPTPETEPETGG